MLTPVAISSQVCWELIFSLGTGAKLSWRLMLTPVRGGGAPIHAAFDTRYFHMQRYASVEQATDP